MQNNPETDFLNKTRAVFTDSLDHIDQHAAVRLREARKRAVASLTPHHPSRPRRYWALPAGAMAAIVIAIAVGMIWRQQNTRPALPFAAGNNEDMSIVLGNDNLDMYADLDFYSWLQTQQQKTQNTDTGGGHSG